MSLNVRRQRVCSPETRRPSPRPGRGYCPDPWAKTLWWHRWGVGEAAAVGGGTCLSILHSRYSLDSFLHKAFSKLRSRRHFMNFSLKLLHSPGTRKEQHLLRQVQTGRVPAAASQSPGSAASPSGACFPQKRAENHPRAEPTHSGETRGGGGRTVSPGGPWLCVWKQRAI